MQLLLQQLEKSISSAESDISSGQSAKASCIADGEQFKKSMQDLEMSAKKGDADMKSKEHQIRQLQVSYIHYSRLQYGNYE